MNTLLAYSITTDPFPLQASAVSGASTPAQVTVVATNNTGSDVALQGIMIRLPIGQGSTQLTNDSADIEPIPPANWTKPQIQTPAGYVQYSFLPQAGYGTLGANQSLNFILNKIQVNGQTGVVEIDVTEGSGNCVPPNCPVQKLSLTKFPNGWGEVSFWTTQPPSTNPIAPIISAGSSIALNWSGPSDAAYSIEFYTPQTGIVNVPPQGGIPLSNEGQYPNQGDSPLTLQENTTFYLNVLGNINGQAYSAQQNIPVTVIVAPPVFNTFAAVPPGVDMLNPESAQLQWTTSNVSEVTIENVGTFIGAQAVSGNCPIAPGETTQYFATGYGESGYQGPPATGSTWLSFIGTVNSGFLNVWNPNPCVLWNLSLGPGRDVFVLNSTCDGPWDPQAPGGNFDSYLTLQPGIQIADLGTAQLAAGYSGVMNGSYAQTHNWVYIWEGSMSNMDTNTISGQGSCNVGSTWGIKFSDGLLALLWLDSAVSDNSSPNQWAFVFKWVFYNK